MVEARQLAQFPVHLGLGATVVPQPEFGGLGWYGSYADRHGADGADGRLVSLYTFTESWRSWERHPAGEELVVCAAGEITLVHETTAGTTETLQLRAGDYTVIPRGAWHTAEVANEVTVLFVTSGLGTEHRPR